MKICKQCKRELDETSFAFTGYKKTKTNERSRGLVCYQCTNFNTKVKDMAKLSGESKKIAVNAVDRFISNLLEAGVAEKAISLPKSVMLLSEEYHHLAEKTHKRVKQVTPLDILDDIFVKGAQSVTAVAEPEQCIAAPTVWTKNDKLEVLDGIVPLGYSQKDIISLEGLAFELPELYEYAISTEDILESMVQEPGGWNTGVSIETVLEFLMDYIGLMQVSDTLATYLQRKLDKLNRYTLHDTMNACDISLFGMALQLESKYTAMAIASVIQYMISKAVRDSSIVVYDKTFREYTDAEYALVNIFNDVIATGTKNDLDCIVNNAIDNLVDISGKGISYAVYTKRCRQQAIEQWLSTGDSISKGTRRIEYAKATVELMKDIKALKTGESLYLSDGSEVVKLK